jgi:multidrug resistance efflux pump
VFLKGLTVIRKYGVQTGAFLLIALAFILSFTSPGSQIFSMRTPGSKATLFPATIRPHRVVTITSQFPGLVTNVRTSIGQAVRTGDILLTVTNPEFQLEYERAKIHVEAIRQRLASSVRLDISDAPEAEYSLRAAKERLSAFSLDGVQTTYERAEAHLRQVQLLEQQGLATDIEVEGARRAAVMALRDLQDAREHISRLKEEVEIAASRVHSVTQRGMPSVVEHFNLRMELQEAEAALKIASRRLDSQTICSTETGTILKVTVNAGDQIPSGFPILQIGQLDRLDFDVPVDAYLAEHLRVGQMANVRIPTEPTTEIPASIAAIFLVPAQDQSAYTVRITAKNPLPSGALIGLTAEVRFQE